MANPQLENGHVKIANDIFDALARIRISGEARQVLDVIIRKTYGFNKKEDAISLSQFCLATGMRRGDVIRGAKKLQGMNIISKKANDVANIYRINKDFDTWNPLAKKRRGEGVAKKQITISKKANNRKQKSYIQKTVSKDTITKDIATVVADVVFSMPEELKKLKESERRDKRIISYYMKMKKYNFENKEQFNLELRRCLRPAKLLVGYKTEQIQESLIYCRDNFKLWTLETIAKRISDLVNVN